MASDEVVFLVLFIVATTVAIAVRRLRVPYTVALVLAGLGLGSRSRERASRPSPFRRRRARARGRRRRWRGRRSRGSRPGARPPPPRQRATGPRDAWTAQEGVTASAHFASTRPAPAGRHRCARRPSSGPRVLAPSERMRGEIVPIQPLRSGAPSRISLPDDGRPGRMAPQVPSRRAGHTMRRTLFPPCTPHSTSRLRCC